MRKPRSKNNDLTGQTFDRWVVLSRADAPGKRGSHWNCRCSCGATSVVSLSNLRSGASRSCGCLQKEVVSARRKKHGMSQGCPTYSVWRNMINRCTNQRSIQFKDYGGRGITICDRWLGPDGFTNFVADVGLRPSPLHSIEREDVNGNYTPENVAWATRDIQNGNKRNSHKITIGGVTKTVTQWAKHYGVGQGMLYHRVVAQGMSVQEALAKPLKWEKLIVTYQGRTMSLRELAQLTGVPHSNLYDRIRRGRSVEDAVNLQIKKTS